MIRLLAQKTSALLAMLVFATLCTLSAPAEARFLQTALPQNKPADTAGISKSITRCEQAIDQGLKQVKEKDQVLLQLAQLVAQSKKINYPKGQIRALVLTADLYREANPAQFESYANQAIAVAANNHEPALEAEINISVAVYNCTVTQDMPKGRKYCNAALAVLQRAFPGSVNYARALSLSAWIHNVQKENGLALADARRALAIAEANHVVKLQHYYSSLAAIYVDMADFKSGLKTGFSGLRMAEKYRDSTAIIENYTTLAGIYQKTGDNRQQIVYLEKAFNMLDFKRNNNDKTWVAANLGKAYNSNHQYQQAIRIIRKGLAAGSPDNKVYPLLNLYLMETYTDIRQYDEALNLYPAVIGDVKNMPIYWVNVFETHIASIRLFLQTKQVAKAEIHLNLLNELNKPGKPIENRMVIELYTFKVDSTKGQYMDAVRHYQQYKLLSDSLTKSTHNKEVAQLQIAYETEKKDEDIAAKAKNITLLQKQSILQENALRSSALIQKLSYSAAALLALVLGITYNRFQIKKKAHGQLAIVNHELEARQEEINTQNDALKQLLIEREWFVKEIHHRVKNNLQIVISLLNSQLANIKDTVAKDILRESQQRMHAISLIHQKLYHEDNLSIIQMDEYARDLVHSLQDSFGIYGKIEFSINAAHIALDISQAVSLGLILNEAVTNAIKYAFVDQTAKGRVEIQMQMTDPATLSLIIKDNGTGLPANFDPLTGGSLGLNLIRGLIRQLRGQIEFINDSGLNIRILVPLVKVI